MTDETMSPRPGDETDERSTPYDFSTDPDGVTRDDLTGTDALLDLMLAVVPGEADTDAAVGITMSVKGTVIAGKAVSFAHWSKLWAAEMTRGHEEVGGAMQDAMGVWVKQRADFRARRKAEKRPVPDPSYICIKDAQLVQGPYRYRAGLMRIKRDQVDAWSLGEPAE